MINPRILQYILIILYPNRVQQRPTIDIDVLDPQATSGWSIGQLIPFRLALLCSRI